MTVLYFHLSRGFYLEFVPSSFQWVFNCARGDLRSIHSALLHHLRGQNEPAGKLHSTDLIQLGRGSSDVIIFSQRNWRTRVTRSHIWLPSSKRNFLAREPTGNLAGSSRLAAAFIDHSYQQPVGKTITNNSSRRRSGLAGSTTRLAS